MFMLLFHVLESCLKEAKMTVKRHGFKSRVF